MPLALIRGIFFQDRFSKGLFLDMSHINRELGKIINNFYVHIESLDSGKEKDVSALKKLHHVL